MDTHMNTKFDGVDRALHNTPAPTYSAPAGAFSDSLVVD